MISYDIAEVEHKIDFAHKLFEKGISMQEKGKWLFLVKFKESLLEQSNPYLDGR